MRAMQSQAKFAGRPSLGVEVSELGATYLAISSVESLPPSPGVRRPVRVSGVGTALKSKDLNLRADALDDVKRKPFSVEILPTSPPAPGSFQFTLPALIALYSAVDIDRRVYSS